MGPTKQHTDESKVYFEHTITDVLKIKLLTDPEEMKLFICLERSGEEPLTDEMVLEIFKQKIDASLIDHTIFHEAIKAANAAPKELTAPRRIAKGRPSEPGHAGKLLLLAKALSAGPESGEDAQEEKEGLYELHLFDNIEAERIVGRIYPPKQGTDGLNAVGKKIPVNPEKPLAITIDATIKREAGEGNHFEILRATTSGYLEKKGQALTIKEELVIPGDVDFRTGNIDFINQVRIKGDVGIGFRVKGKKGVHISGSVQAGSTIIGEDGGLTVGGYLMGSRLEAKGPIHVSNVQEADIETESWVIIGKQAAESTIRAACGVIGEKAHIFGGAVHCVEGCSVGTLGNHVGLSTKVYLTTKSSVTSTYSSLQKQIVTHQDAISLLKAHLGPYAQNPKRIELLQEPHRSKLKALTAKLIQVDKSLISLLEDMKKYQEEQLPENARVTIGKKIYPGVTIYAGDELFAVQEEITASKSIKRVEGKLTFVDPEPITMPEPGNPSEKQNGKR